MTIMSLWLSSEKLNSASYIGLPQYSTILFLSLSLGKPLESSLLFDLLWRRFLGSLLLLVLVRDRGKANLPLHNLDIVPACVIERCDNVWYLEYNCPDRAFDGDSCGTPGRIA